MNCSEWEERLALYAGGDLLPKEQAAVERHVQDCAGCQVFLSGLTESLRLLQEEHGEEISPAHFSAVRARVFAELGSRARPWHRKTWIYALVTGTLALLIALWMWPSHEPAAPARLARVVPSSEVPPAPAVEPRPVPLRADVVHRPVRRRSVVRPRPADLPAKPLVVKLTTDDPDVVIYWITETRGD